MLKKLKLKKYIPYIVIVVVSLLLCFNFFRLNLSEFNEARIHIARITSIKEVIMNKIFPSFISAKHMSGFGYALNIFYGPITTYVPIILSFIFGSSIMALKVFTLLTIILAGFMMYNFVLKISKNKLLSLVSALIYIAAPYKLTDIYSRNAVGEYTAFIFIPLVFNGIYELINGNYKKNYLIVIGAVGLILSHTITTIYVAIFALAYLAINYKKLNKKRYIYLFIDLLLIILLTAFYLVPLLEHKVYGDYTIFDSDSMGATGKRVLSTGLSLSDLFSSEFGSQEIVFSFGIIIIFGLILTPFVYKRAKENKEYGWFLLFALISLWGCTKCFPWFLLPNFLTIIQFAWRLEGFFIFFISYVCACNIVTASQMIKDKRNILSIVAIIAITLCGVGGTVRYASNDELKQDKEYEEYLLKASKFTPFQVNRDYLPLNSERNTEYIENRKDKVIVLEGSATINNEEKNGLNLRFEIENIDNAILELPYIYYHGYTVKINEKKIDNYESENGFVCINLNETGTVTVNYTGTLLEKIAYIISGATIVVAVVYSVKKLYQEKRIGEIIEKRTKKDK